ncbi:MAG: AEC family transporter, partial [Acidaminococcaceae bacterium]|nr:AEC family transporter [Acidaminococcaceae bacterium]
RPPALGILFHNLVHVLAWVSLLPVGFLIDFGRARFYYRKVISMLWLRFVIVPVLFYLLFKLLFTDQVLLGSLLLMAATPAAINSVITAQLYKLNVDITIASFLLTTVVFVLVVFPLFFFYIHFGGRL